jgi:hypothetical protein
MYSAAERQRILGEARKNISKHELSKDDDAVVERSAAAASGSEQAWWQWVDARIAACLEEHGESVGTAMGDFCGPQFAALKRELEVTRDEVRVLREQVGLARELAGLRAEVAQAKSEVPKLPAIAQRLEEGQARLQRELTKTKEKLGRVRVDQSVADFKLRELDKATAARSKSLEMKIETTTQKFEMSATLHPDAAAALRSFATETLKGARQDEKIWVFDPSPAAGAA